MTAPASPSSGGKVTGPVAGHAAAGLMTAAMAAPTPAARLRLLTELLDTIEAARIEAMTDAAADGWGLRRIAGQCGMSHEQVRRLLTTAATTKPRPPAAARRGKEQAICRECGGAARRFCARCRSEDGLLPGGLCQSCTLTDTLAAVLDDGTGRIHEPLEPFAEALQAEAHPASILDWLTDPAVRDLLAGLARGRVTLTHEALNPLEPAGTVEHLPSPPATSPTTARRC